jgi:hypothetical protein
LAKQSIKWDLGANLVLFGVVPPEYRVRVSMAIQFVYLIGVTFWDASRRNIATVDFDSTLASSIATAQTAPLENSKNAVTPTNLTVMRTDKLRRHGFRRRAVGNDYSGTNTFCVLHRDTDRTN